MVSDAFESAKFLIKLAGRHARDFDLLANKFLESQPYAVWADYDAETRVHEVRVKIIREFPEELRGYASDAVKNIRDALDQAMSAATLVMTGKRSREAHFPFGTSATDLENSLWTEADRNAVPKARKTRNCRGIPEELFPFIRRVKPYPHDGDQWALKALQKVSGPHKHGVALALGSTRAPAYAGIAKVEIKGVSYDRVPQDITVIFHKWSPSETEFIVTTITGLPADGNPEFNMPFHIAFDHPELQNVPASTLIQRWGQRTDGIISGLEKTVAMLVAERGT